MAKKDVLFGKELVLTQSLAASFTTNPVRIRWADNYGFNIDCTGVTDNTGTFYIQHRIAKDNGATDPIDYSAWATLTLDTIPTLANANDVFLIYLNQIPPGELRIGFTAAGGTPDGSCDIWYSATSLGG
jgi:hypothetical protein